MVENVKVRWLTDHEQTKIAPKTLASQVYNDDGTLFKDTIAASLNNFEETVATKDFVKESYEKLKSSRILGFYCVEDVTVVVNGISTVYPANTNIEISFAEEDTFEIIPTSDNSILSLSAYPGALGTFYPWLEGVAQFSNILFDMNAEEFYSKWSQGNQGAYHVQTAQYVNCIFWSDNPYISEVARRTNYTLTHTSQLPLCYSTIPDNTFKSFYLAFNANTDPNWSNAAYKESFAKATWATQVFSYYGARVVGFPGHDSPTLTITLPKDCRGLMIDDRNIEGAGVFDAANTTNFGAKSGSWREAFGDCPSLRRLYIKNLKVNLNISWSPIDYASIKYIIDSAANTNAITISVSPYTYNLLSESDFELATSKNITIALITTNYIEDKRLSSISTKADKTYVDEAVAGLVDSAPETLNTLGELATAFNEHQEVVDALDAAITNKKNKDIIVTYVEGSHTTVTHDTRDLYNEIMAGTTVYFKKGTELLPVMEADPSYITFFMFYVNMNNKPQQKVVVITGNSIMIDQDDTYTYVATADLAEELDNYYNKVEVDNLVNTLTESNVLIVDCPNESEISHTFEQIMEAVNQGKAVYALLYGTVYAPLVYIAEDGSYIEFNNINSEVNEDHQSYAWSEGLRVYNDNTFISKSLDLLTLVHNDIQTQDGEKNIITVINQLVEKSDNTLVKTEQALTEEELAQVKNNLRYIGKDVGGLEVTPYIIEEKDFGTENHRIEETPSEPVIAGEGAEVFNLYDGMNVASGAYSVSQGHHTVATGDYAVAQGHWTMATGMASKASGLLTVASGNYATAEGTRTLASKNNTHAEGDVTQATGASAHSEGNETIASGNVSHAEGWKTNATGIASHAEGEGTIAAGRGQTAMGRWNVSDTSSKLIVGIGTGASARKNGFKVSSTGQGYFASDVYANDSKKLATEEYTDTKIAELVDSAPDTLNTLGELATALQENNEVVDVLNQAITNKADKTDVLLTTAQTLSNDELTQVRQNLKFIGRDVEGQTFTIDGVDVVASPNAEIFGDYANNIATGQWSIAEGCTTVAKGRVAHAEGAFTKALNDGCHTEGYGTEATGYWSHAEGEYTKVTSYASHAEGSYCTLPDGTKRYGIASGYASHVEGGGCHTTGSCSHAEGLATTASGAQSHVEGRYTIAAGGAQHVEGIANIEDTESKYIHIAGNGAFDARSNAYTLDWNGNAWFAGDVYTGSTSGTNKDEDSKKLATEEYVTTSIENKQDKITDTLILADTITGAKYAIQIQNGQLVTSLIEEEV